MKNQNLTEKAALLPAADQCLLHNLILKNTDATFLLIDTTLSIRYMNEDTRLSMQKVFGRSIEVGQSVTDLVPAERRPSLIQLYSEVFAGQEATSITHNTIDGVDYVFENRYRPAVDESGMIVGALVTATDITARYRAQQELKVAEERWRFALEGGRQGVWDWNLQTGEVYYSKACKQLYGYEEQEMLGGIMDWKSMLHPEDYDRVIQAVENHKKSDDPSAHIQYRARHKKGHYIWIEARGKIVGYDSAHNPLRMIGTHTDITELVTASEKYRLLFYSNPLPMWTYDTDTMQFLEVNDEAVQHYGFSREEFLSKCVWDIEQQEPHSLFQHKEPQIPDQGYTQFFAQHVRKNGERCEVEVTATLLSFEHGRKVLVSVKDITEKKRIEQQLLLSNELYKNVTLATHDMVWDWDLSNHKVWWSDNFFKQFGWERPEDSKLSFQDSENHIHLDDRLAVISSLLATTADPTQSNWHAEYRHYMADGNFAHVSDRAYIIRDKNGQAIRVIGAMQNISERKYSELLLSLERSIYALSTNPNIDLDTIAVRLLKGIETMHPDAQTAVCLVNEDLIGTILAYHKLPPEFVAALTGRKWGETDGACGASIHSKNMVIVEDATSNPLCEKLQDLIRTYQIRSAWSVPIVLSSGKVIATFSLYHAEPKSPSKTEFNTIERIANILRTILENRLSMQAIRQANERFDIVMRATNDMIWDWNLETNEIYRDSFGVARVYGLLDPEETSNLEKWLNRVHPEDREQVLFAIEHLTEGKKQTFEIEYRFRTEDNEWRFIYDRGMALHNERGRPIRMIGSAQNISERKKLEMEIRNNMLERQRAINQATVETQEMERKEIGSELHDNVNQVLTTTKLYLELATSHPELKDEMIQKSTANIIKVINEIRQLSRSLMEPSIGDLGLVEAISDLVENLNMTRKLHVLFRADDGFDEVLTKNQKLTLFRIIQEATNNIIRHSGAKFTSIVLEKETDSGKLIIEDNGNGFHPEKVKRGTGLNNIKNRVYLVNGDCRIESAPGIGTRILIQFPIINATNNQHP